MPDRPTSYPVNLRLAGRPVLVVGGGPVAARKVEALVQAGARVTVVAPTAAGAITERPEVDWRRRRYQSPEAGAYRLVVTATDNPAVNAEVARDCEKAGVFVNSADDPANCTFTLPSVARRAHLQVAVSTDGRSPALASWLRRRIEREIDSGYSALLNLLADARTEARKAYGTSEVAGWDTALDGGLLELVRVGRVEEARTLLRSHLGLDGQSQSCPTGESLPASERRSTGESRPLGRHRAEAAAS
ncbi:MAG: bifunctional precorrin-2 dehydrogenase/sirohydrochlorin ferrochelatase [Acidimicrobiaceae bacterium]|nr:bifunctional precorrin-2 dehydrogenase/sirohydrochlorin ferrochelatase [Acidimicrobiaceae bacterium]